jgi:hypothetical protein
MAKVLGMGGCLPIYMTFIHLFCVCGTGFRTQGFTLARQLYHLSYSTSPLSTFYTLCEVHNIERLD